MDINDELRDQEMQERMAFHVDELEELFERIRGFTDSDLCEWVAVQEWLDWKRVDRLQTKAKRNEDRAVSDVQLLAVRAFGMESFADLSRPEA